MIAFSDDAECLLFVSGGRYSGCNKQEIEAEEVTFREVGAGIRRVPENSFVDHVNDLTV